jgi:hypothetical protein
MCICDCCNKQVGGPPVGAEDDEGIDVGDQELGNLHAGGRDTLCQAPNLLPLTFKQGPDSSSGRQCFVFFQKGIKKGGGHPTNQCTIQVLLQFQYTSERKLLKAGPLQKNCQTSQHCELWCRSAKKCCTVHTLGITTIIITYIPGQQRKLHYEGE